ncbi:MAG: Txe/YoeB family addiction module toxin [Tannerellaceae bacterium]|jgi:toxin YoeB|nr:Txe/YoeB family addiction module toxin [Tannerellaceae bacterium]
MSYKIDFTANAQKVLEKYKKSNPVAFKKIIRFMPELEQHPRTGTGHPEPLKAENSVSYSRRITAHDRLIYDIYDDTVTVLVIEVEGHYNDK